MEKTDEFLEKMENLKVPGIDPTPHQKLVKMAIMNAGRSATLGLWLISVPGYFLLCVFMYYHFHVNVSWFGAMFNLLSALSKYQYVNLWGPLVLFILPVISIIINGLAITHVMIQKAGMNQIKVRELSITIKLKVWNLLLILISLVIIGVFISYVITENITIKN